MFPLTREALANTYSHPSYAETWGLVEDYWRFVEYAADHPQQKSSAVSSALDLPRGRVRGWLNGRIPDAVRALREADEREWFDASTDIASSFTILLGAVLSGGSIASDTYQPSFSLSEPESRDELIRALDTVGVNHTLRHEECDTRATEIVATKPGTVLGRALFVLGAPRGGKTLATFPAWLASTDEKIRTRFLRFYVRERGAIHTEKATRSLVEDRPEPFKESLATTIEATTHAPATAGKRGVVVSADAVRKLGLSD